ncbi:MAG: aminodeoxychorismate synthase component I [Cyclobacteriaceae bacterium]|nr:aminodeoxychorismate synthase component I [Cyclobacteriaceae bacterium]
MNTWGGQQLPFFFMIDFELQKPVLHLLDQLPDSISFDINGVSKNKPIEIAETPFSFKLNPVAFETYKKAFDEVMSELNYGNSYLLNLTFPTPIKTSLNLESIFYRSSASYKLMIKDEMVVFSPEPFVKISNGKITSYPMKGTIDASIANAKEILLADPKEQAEHATIVDLIRNDLSKVASNVKVDRYRYVEKISTSRKSLLQVSSKIEGTLTSNFRNQLGSTIFSLLPAGSISGAPKKKTLDIIKKSENSPRSYFTGIMGVFDGVNLDSGVMIRFIEQKNDKFVFRSGGGITSLSNVKTEYQELLDKVYVPFN